MGKIILGYIYLTYQDHKSVSHQQLSGDTCKFISTNGTTLQLKRNGLDKASSRYVKKEFHHYNKNRHYNIDKKIILKLAYKDAKH